MWQHRDLQDSYRKAGWRESDFVGRSLAAGRSPAGTLARPVSTQGGNTPSRNRPDIYGEKK